MRLLMEEEKGGKNASERLAQRGLDVEFIIRGAEGMRDGLTALAAGMGETKGGRREEISNKILWWKNRITIRRLGQWILLLFVCYNVVVLPWVLGFDLWPAPLGFYISMVISDAVFIFLLLWNALLPGTRPLLKRQRYLRSLSFVADLVSAVPFSTVLFVLSQTWIPPSGRSSSQYATVQVLFWLCCLRLTQIYQLVSWLSRFRRSRRFNSTGVTFFNLAVAFVFYVHIAACVFFVIAGYEHYLAPSRANWVNQNTIGLNPGTDLFAQSFDVQYLISLYSIVLTLAGQPPNLFTPVELVFCLIILISGYIILMSVILGTFVNTVARRSERQNELQLLLDRIKHKCFELNLSDWVRKEMLASWSRVGKKLANYHLVARTMPEFLQPLETDLKLDVVREVFAFLRDQADLTVTTNRAWFALTDVLLKHHSRFAIAMFERFEFQYFFRGQDVCVQGDVADRLWMCHKGALEVLVDEQVVAAVYPGTVLGIACLSMHDEVRTATIRARGAVTLWELSRRSFMELAHRFPHVLVLFDDFFHFVSELQQEENASRDASFSGMFPGTRISEMVVKKRK